MKKSESNPVAALCGVITLIAVEMAVRHCMKKYGGKKKFGR